MLSISKVHKIESSGQRSLNDISLALVKGEFVFLAGPPGAGKSTILKLVSGDLSFGSGEITVLGKSQKPHKAHPDSKKDLGLISHENPFIRELTIFQNLELPLVVRGLSSKNRKILIDSFLEKFKLSSISKFRPDDLSHTEKKIVSIIRSVIHKPSLVLADEPILDLDSNFRNLAMDLFLEANAAGVGVLFATKSLELVKKYNFRTIIVEDGKLAGDFDNIQRLH